MDSRNKQVVTFFKPNQLLDIENFIIEYIHANPQERSLLMKSVVCCPYNNKLSLLNQLKNERNSKDSFCEEQLKSLQYLLQCSIEQTQEALNQFDETKKPNEQPQQFSHLNENQLADFYRVTQEYKRLSKERDILNEMIDKFLEEASLYTFNSINNLPNRLGSKDTPSAKWCNVM